MSDILDKKVTKSRRKQKTFLVINGPSTVSRNQKNGSAVAQLLVLANHLLLGSSTGIDYWEICQWEWSTVLRFCIKQVLDRELLLSSRPLENSQCLWVLARSIITITPWSSYYLLFTVTMYEQGVVTLVIYSTLSPVCWVGRGIPPPNKMDGFWDWCLPVFQHLSYNNLQSTLQ